MGLAPRLLFLASIMLGITLALALFIGVLLGMLGGGGAGGSGTCGCVPGFVCGVGLTSAGKACGPSECCSESISSCALDI